MTFLESQKQPSYKIRGEIRLKAINVVVPLEITTPYASLNDAKTRAKVFATQLNIKCIVVDSKGETAAEFDFQRERKPKAPKEE